MNYTMTIMNYKNSYIKFIYNKLCNSPPHRCSLESIMMTEVSQKKRARYRMIFPRWDIKKHGKGEIKYQR